ncbi:hypothetical protein OG589_42840 [Sphaerisporangium sp. NBC_01403]|uniref:hypothetical protein n=1 Tax=Sphaerisporangium sp. NBC_01403 TaxID=2903599 RepID=UPI00324FDEF4
MIKRWGARLTGVVAAALIAPALATAANAQAKPTDPVDALHKQFVAGHGVKVSHHSALLRAGKPLMEGFTTGKLGFARSGIVSSDLTSRYHLSGAEFEGLEDLQTPVRQIGVGGKTYASGETYKPYLPVGMSWVRYAGTPFTTQTGLAPDIDLAEHRTYQGLLATTNVKKPGGTIDGTATTVYAGTITAARLRELSPATKKRLGGLSETATKVDWKLWLGRDLLPRRFSVTRVDHDKEFGEVKQVTTSNYSSWRAKVVITAPPAWEVVDAKDLPKEPFTLPDPTFAVLPDAAGDTP